MIRSFVWAAGAAVVLVSSSSAAFPWMVKHAYQGCAACHVDPSGGGQLSLYGRAQADTLVLWKLNPPKPGEEQDVAKSANFLWGIELPEALNLSGNLRGGALIPVGGTVRPLVMAIDFYATLKLDRFVAHVTTGVGVRNTGLGAIAPLCTSAPCGVQWLAREVWAGVTFSDDAVMIRAGRMNLPFGLRNNEHTSWVREQTVTDINLGQQYGVSAAYNNDELRAEVMGIAGNYSLGPDAYRERGYSAYVEHAFRTNLYAGLSSLITAAQADLVNQKPVVRHAHGLMARFSPAEKLALMAEADLLIWQQPALLDRIGFVSWLQADYELVQGLHVIGSFEALHRDDGARSPNLGGWAAISWWPLPHFEVRVDGIYRRSAETATSAASGNFTILGQMHVFL